MLKMQEDSVQKGCQGYFLVNLKMQHSVQRGWRGCCLVMLKMQRIVQRGKADLMSCDAEDVTFWFQILVAESSIPVLESHIAIFESDLLSWGRLSCC